MSYLYLAVAILCEVVATTALKASYGFTRVGPTAIAFAGYRAGSTVSDGAVGGMSA